MSKPFLNCDSSVILKSDVSKGRRGVFTGDKIKAFRKASDSEKCDDAIRNVSLDQFVAMLEQFSAKDASGKPLYNAVRIYFGAFPDTAGSLHVPAGKAGFPTLLFVPTTGDLNKPAIGDIVTSMYFYIDEKGKATADKDGVAAGWIGNFNDNWVPILNDDGESETEDDFDETRTLIYPIDSIAGDGVKEIGLLGLITCGRRDTENPITGLDILFSCFTTSETEKTLQHPYQLSLIFHMPQKNDPTGVSFGSVKYKLGLVDADTGMPCPPNGNCQSKSAFVKSGGK